MNKGLYTVNRYYPPKFFINVNGDGELGHSLIMLTRYCSTKEEVNESFDEDTQLAFSIQGNDELEIAVDIYTNDAFDKTVDGEDMVNGRYYVAAKPLIDTIWTLDNEKQSEIVAYLKSAMLCSIMGETLTPSTDLVNLSVILEKYSIPISEEDKRFSFMAISSPIYIQNSQQNKK